MTGEETSSVGQLVGVRQVAETYMDQMRRRRLVAYRQGLLRPGRPYTAEQAARLSGGFGFISGDFVAVLVEVEYLERVEPGFERPTCLKTGRVAKRAVGFVLSAEVFDFLPGHVAPTAPETSAAPPPAPPGGGPAGADWIEQMRERARQQIRHYMERYGEEGEA